MQEINWEAIESMRSLVKEVNQQRRSKFSSLLKTKHQKEQVGKPATLGKINKTKIMERKQKATDSVPQVPCDEDGQIQEIGFYKRNIKNFQSIPLKTLPC